MNSGILRALNTLKSHPYVQYVGLGFAGLVKNESVEQQEGRGKQRKTKLELIRLSAAVCGIELCYAAETAFVSPILLKLGVPVSLMTLVWCVSPVLGFFLVPIMGSLSDRCPFSLGRRRPFILAMSVGIVLGLALVPNGEALGRWMGDYGAPKLLHPKFAVLGNSSGVRKRDAEQGTSIAITTNDYAPDKVLKMANIYNYFNTTPWNHRLVYKSPDSTEIQNQETLAARKSDSLKYATLQENEMPAVFGNKLDDVRNGGDNRYQVEISSKRTSPQNETDNLQERESSAKLSYLFHLSDEHFRGIILTIAGVALLDFNCDACQSPCRAYLLDVSTPDDHSAGLTMFTVMAGLGGTVGYIMGGIDWNSTRFGEAFGGHIRVVFTLVISVFIACVLSTVTSFKETPLKDLGLQEENLQRKKKSVGKSKYSKFTNEDDYEDGSEENTIDSSTPVYYGAVQYEVDTCQYNTLTSKSQSGMSADGVTIYHSRDSALLKNVLFDRDATKESDGNQNLPVSNRFQNLTNLDSGLLALPTESRSRSTPPEKVTSGKGTQDLDIHPAIEISTDVTLRTYLRSIVHMPRCMWVLCLVNLFCWMSLVCYSLYFTDFVGQAVFHGDPQSPPGSDAHNRYDDGVRLGSFGMSLYSFSCSVYSLLIERLVRRFRAKRVYVVGQLVFTVGMIVMASARHKVAVVILSPTAGIMYATLFTMPYLIVAHYHTSGMFSIGAPGADDKKQVRGLGTDVAIVSSMVFLAQFLLSVAMGTIVYAVSSTTTVMVASAILSFLGAITATKVTYLDL